MKKYRFLHSVYLCLVPFFVFSSELIKKENGYGVALNSAFNGEVTPLRTIATGVFIKNKNQFEFGVGFHPFIRNEKNISSIDVNYKWFANQHSGYFNMYLLANFSYINTKLVTFYPTTYDYLFLLGGYGVELSSNSGFYVDTNVSFGGFTYKKDSQNPAMGYLNDEQFFKEFKPSMSIQASIGYRI